MAKNCPEYKLVVIGSGGVGKSCVTIQFVQQCFVADYDPTIEDSYTKQCTVDNEVYKLDIVDTAGQDEFRVMREQFIMEGDGFLLVFSLTDKNSFQDVEKFRQQILRVKDVQDFPIVICGNKSDLVEDRRVSQNEIDAMIQYFNVPYLETSAKLNTNIDNAFHSLVRYVRKHGTDRHKTGSASKGSKQRRRLCICL